MRRYERLGRDAIAVALQGYFEATWGGLTAESVHQAAIRAASPGALRPVQDALIAWLQRVATGGAEFGQDVIERHIFGVKRHTPGHGPLEVDWALANNAAAEWAIEYGRTLTGQLAKTTNERIQREIANFIRNGETMDQLIERIRGGYLYSQARAEAIAVTETTRAFAEGNRAAWRESGVIEGREWRTANDELVCPICAPLAGAVVGLDEPFPGGGDGPPGHTRCRCWLTPVVAIGESA